MIFRCIIAIVRAGRLEYTSLIRKINTLATRRRTEWMYSSGKDMRPFSRHVFLIDDFLDEKLLCITISIHCTSKVTFNYGAWEFDAFPAQHYDDKWDFRRICCRLLRFLYFFIDRNMSSSNIQNDIYQKFVTQVLMLADYTHFTIYKEL